MDLRVLSSIGTQLKLKNFLVVLFFLLKLDFLHVIVSSSSASILPMKNFNSISIRFGIVWHCSVPLCYNTGFTDFGCMCMMSAACL